MKRVKVIIEWASDGGVGAMMQDEAFAGQGDTIKEAIDDMRKGVAFYIETAKEMNFPYKEYLDGDYDIEMEYDVPSLIQYASHYMSDTALGEVAGVSPVQIGRYSRGEAKPRPDTAQKIFNGLQAFVKKFAAALTL